MTLTRIYFNLMLRALSIGLIFLLLAFIISLISSPKTDAVAGINRTINFQGKLVNNPLKTNVSNTSYTVVFTIYDRHQGGTVLWQETQTVTTADGIFRVNLGSVTPFPANFNFNWDGLYLGMKVNSDSEMTPRIQLAAVPYAFNAEKVSGLTVQDSSGNASTSGTLQIPNAKTINLGTQNLTFTTSGDTTLTLPTTGTLATLAGNEQLTNKTIGSTGLVFSGAGTDITTGTNEDFTLTPNGFGNINLTGDFDSQVLIGGSGAGTEFPLLVRSGIGNNAALAIDNLNNGDLFTASASGTTKFTVANSGNITATGTLTGLTGLTLTSGAINLGGTNGTSADCLKGGASAAWGSCGAGSNWTLDSLNGILRPNNNTLDLIIGGTSSSSAKFQFTNLISGNPTFKVFDSTSTKSVNIFHDGTFGYIQSSAGDLVLGDGTSGLIIENAVYNDTTNNSGSIKVSDKLFVQHAANSVALGVFDNTGTGDLFTASASGVSKFTIAGSGNITATGSLTGLTGLTLSSGAINLVGTNGTSSDCLKGGSTASWVSCASGAAGTWVINSATGVHSPINNTLDLLIGGTASNSAKFAVLNIAGNTPTASISANSGANSVFLTGTGNLATTNKQTLTLGGATTGDINLSGFNTCTLTTDSTGKLICASGGGSDLESAIVVDSAPETATAVTTSQVTFGPVNINPDTTSADIMVDASFEVLSGSAADQTLIVNLEDNGSCTGNTIATMTIPITVASGTRIGNFTISGVDTNPGIASQSYSLCMSTATGTTNIDDWVINATAIDTNSPISGGDGVWQVLGTGVLVPLNQTTDLLIGGNSTDSAKFGVLNIAGGTPVASVSSGLNGSGIYMSSDGSIQSTTKHTLTLGGSTTGSIQFNPGGLVSPSLFLKSNGDIGIGTANNNPLASLDVRANTINSGGTVAIASVSGATSFASLIVNNSGAGDLFTASKSGARKFVIQNNGNIQFAGTTNFLSTISSAATAARSWTLPDANGTFCLQNSSSCGFGLGTNWWTTSSDGKAIIQINTTQDLLIGGTSTSSAKLRLAGSLTSGLAALIVNQTENQDIFTASASGITRFNITNAGALGITSGYGSLDECLKSGGGATSAVIWGSCGSSGAAGTWVLNSGTGTHYAINTTADTLFGGTSTSSAKLRLASSLTSGLSALIINQTENQDIFTASSSGTPRFALGQNGELKVGPSGNLSAGSNGQCLISSGNGLSVGWGGCASGGSGNWWQLNSALGTLVTGNQTLDVLFGGTNGATSSATFKITGNTSRQGTLPVASIAARTSFAALVVNNSGTGDIFTASKSGRTIFTINQESVQVGTGSAGVYNPVLFKLDNKVNNGDPAGGSNGSMYYNSSMGKFRCYENGGWKDCTGSTAKLGETTLGGAAATLDVTLSPTAEYISCTIAGPAPSGTGIIHMRFNSDSGAASYGWTQGGQLAGANLADTQDNSDDTIQLTGTNTPSTDFIFKIYFDNISGNVKTVQWDGTIGKAAGVTSDWYQGSGNFYTTAGQITSVNFSRSANNFAAGTYAFCEGKDVADYAENYYTKDKTVQAADVVTGDPTLPAGIQKATKPYDQKLIGVISTKPAITLDEGIGFSHGRPVPVALAGRIPVKVSGVNGPIKAGDLLTSSSIPGVAMKATKAGAVFGQAMESFSGEGTGKIMVFVKSGNFTGESMTDTIVDQIPGIKKDEVGFEILNFILENPSSTDEEVININEIITDRVVAGLEFVAPRIIAKEASIENILGKNASLSGTLTVDTIRANKIEGLEVIVGKLDFLDSKVASVSSSLEEQAKKLTQQLIDSKLLMDASRSATESQDNVVAAGLETIDGITIVPGDLRVKGNTLVEGILNVVDTLTANNLIANGLATFFGDVVFKEKAVFEKGLVLGENNSGIAVIKKGDKKTEVKFETGFEKEPLVNVNLFVPKLSESEFKEQIDEKYCDKNKELEVCQEKIEDETLLNNRFIVSRKSKDGFTINLARDAVIDTKFSWTVIQTK